MDNKPKEKKEKERMSPDVIELLTFAGMLKDYQTDIPAKDKSKKN